MPTNMTDMIAPDFSFSLSSDQTILDELYAKSKDPKVVTKLWDRRIVLLEKLIPVFGGGRLLTNSERKLINELADINVSLYKILSREKMA